MQTVADSAPEMIDITTLEYSQTKSNKQDIQTMNMIILLFSYLSFSLFLKEYTTQNIGKGLARNSCICLIIIFLSIIFYVISCEMWRYSIIQLINLSKDVNYQSN